MSRVDQAREAYLKGNIREVKITHTPSAINRAVRHEELHQTGFILPEIILGGQDGLVNVLGVILGVAAATASNQIVIVAGLAAALAESVSMAAVAYTSKLAEADYYQSEYERERWEIEKIPTGEKEEIKALYRTYGFKGKVLNEIVDRITSDKKIWLRVMMEQELNLKPVDRARILPIALIVGVSAVVGSFIPLSPFFFFPIKTSIIISFIISALALFIVGYYKAKVTLGRRLFRQGLEMVTIGVVSAIVGYLIGSLFKI